MKTFIKAALISSVMGAAILSAAPPANARVGISLDFGDVAIGYRDGYYDSGHHWHHWRHASDYQSYGRAHPENYHDFGHNEHHDDHRGH